MSKVLSKKCHIKQGRREYSLLLSLLYFYLVFYRRAKYGRPYKIDVTNKTEFREGDEKKTKGIQY
ncbi:hypothetical protein J7L85_03580 [candidate division WOR-3 bacterium]|nr:hypothetical protein [candidate division WOR-3 bacterium]